MMPTSSGVKAPGLLRMASGIAILPMSCKNAPRAITRICSAVNPIALAIAIVKAVTRLECPSVSRSLRSRASPSASKVMS